SDTFQVPSHGEPFCHGCNKFTDMIFRSLTLSATVGLFLRPHQARTAGKLDGFGKGEPRETAGRARKPDAMTSFSATLCHIVIAPNGPGWICGSVKFMLRRKTMTPEM